MKNSDKENVNLEESRKNKKIDRENYKVTDTYIINIVHHYFYIFYAWVPKNKIGRSLIKAIGLLGWSTIFYASLFVVNNFVSIFYINNLSNFFIISTVIGWFFMFISLTMGNIMLSPLKGNTIENRMKFELGINSNLKNIDKNNMYTKRFELEEIWVSEILNNNNIDYLVEEINNNIEYRKPTSRSLELVVLNILKNSYIVNSLVVVSTVALTVSLSPLNSSINNDNFFSIMTFLLSSSVAVWFILIIILLLIKFLFMTFVWFIEYTTTNKQLVIWRYEIFRDMLARHQKVIVKKPRIRYIPKIVDKN
ncbi:hypothetical protein [Psychrobacter aestuarii]|uniref:hypothetical protein n=1 Tax=Psychrobacter aestuarii TaxID=556327 RepID=UPI001918CCE2|nr:hypothetical protein [Psychrobacter aestuarii]